jgi:hypothetical protein
MSGAPAAGSPQPFGTDDWLNDDDPTQSQTPATQPLSPGEGPGEGPASPAGSEAEFFVDDSILSGVHAVLMASGTRGGTAGNNMPTYADVQNASPAPELTDRFIQRVAEQANQANPSVTTRYVANVSARDEFIRRLRRSPEELSIALVQSGAIREEVTTPFRLDSPPAKRFRFEGFMDLSAARV